VTVLIKLFYAGALMALIVLMVAFGIRTVYTPPEEPEYPAMPATVIGWSPFPPSVAGAEAPPLTPEQAAYQQEQERYREAYERYREDRADYRRNVFLAAALAAVAFIAGGIAADARLDALRLGLVAGGLGTLIYGVAQAGGDLGETAPAFIFVVALAGLAFVLVAGYRWLGRQADA